MPEIDWKKHVEFDPRYLRPAEVPLLRGDASKAKRELGWEPKVGFEELVRFQPRGGGDAALGLVLNSPAVVIGAMLVAPLMSPIVATGLAVVEAR